MLVISAACSYATIGASRALLIDEIAAPDFGRRLQFTIDPAIPLLQPRWVPRKIHVDEGSASED
jgi:hypothetical protein